MVKKSALLEYVIKSILKMDGVIKPTSNYFVVATLQLLEKKDSGNVPDEIKGNSTAQSELESVSEFIANGYDISYKETYEAILENISGSSYDEISDILSYNRIRHATSRKTEGGDITVVDYLTGMFDSPTDEISNTIISKKKNVFTVDEDDEEEEEEEETTSSDPFDDWFDIKPKKKTPPKPRLSGKEELLQGVTKSRTIQKELLKHIYGQDNAVNTFVSGYFRSILMRSTRKNDKKPQATFLFAGPPGVGKTFLAEKAAEAIGLPFMRFDMSEYADKEANIEFCGSDKVYKNGKEGNVTSFVSENPECVLLFDEIEKAHIVVTHLFLQILDAGRIRDNYTDEEVSFSKAIIIFTTNVGRGLYEDPTIVNLSALPRKKILSALGKDKNPVIDTPLFPAAICSRFASGNVIMFNHLEANNLHSIVEREINANLDGFKKSTKIKASADEKLSTALMLSEGGKADARTVRGRANAFFYDELYELFRMLASKNIDVQSLEEIKINVKLDKAEEKIRSMFEDSAQPSVLIFTSSEKGNEIKNKLKNITCHVATTMTEAKDILFNNDISVILCDVFYDTYDKDDEVLNIEDIKSAGHDFLTYVLSCHAIPLYIIEEKEGTISPEEELSFAALGARGKIPVYQKSSAVESIMLEKCKSAYQQSKLLKLAKENKVVTFKTSQTVTRGGKCATINLFDFALSLVTDTDDSKNVLDSASKPNVKFDDVIGAKDAKRELTYFVNYLKDPVKFMRKGVSAPKGVLLYGPPGTGKTLLAKAMAGESDVTYLAAEGNEFLKRFIGEGPGAVHSLFNAARKYAPSVIFIDEIDAIGKNRMSGAADTVGDVLTSFLTEMDGFRTDTSRPVFVLAATNYDIESGGARSLDPALLRRFDRRILVDLPDKSERLQFLKMKISKYPIVKLSDAQIDNIAMRSTGMSLAALDSVFEMALRNAIRTEKDVINDEDFDQAFETFTGGDAKEWKKEELLNTARHEAGHALVSWLGGDAPSYVTIVARGNHGGYMQHGEDEKKGSYTREELFGIIRTSLAGRGAEIVYNGEKDGISTGASADLRHATSLAERMICSYGMDEKLGMSVVDPSCVSDSYQSKIRDRVNEILENELKNAIKQISENKAAIDALVNVLMDKNHLNGDEIDKIFKENTSKK